MGQHPVYEVDERTGRRTPVNGAKEPKGSPPPKRTTAPELGLLLLVFAAPAWLGGARFTVDGAIRGLNWLLGWFGAPVALPMLAGWWLLGGAVAVGVFFTRAEIVRFPIRRAGGTLRLIGMGALVAWALTSSVDFVTTFIGVTALPQDAWQLHRWVAATPWAAVLSALGLTFGPEIAFVTATRLIGWR